MHIWVRVFAPEAGCPAESLLGAGEFGREGADWFWAEVGGVRVERFLADEEGIRAELNLWAAIVESTGGDAALMERIITSRQLFTIHGPVESARSVGETLARGTGGFCLEDEADG